MQTYTDTCTINMERFAGLKTPDFSLMKVLWEYFHSVLANSKEALVFWCSFNNELHVFLVATFVAFVNIKLVSGRVGML